MKIETLIAVVAATTFGSASAFAFEGRISATLTRAGEIQNFLYTVATNQLRIERIETNGPYPKNVIDRDSGTITLWLPHNHSFVRLKPATETASSPFSGVPAMPSPPGGLPPGIGPQSSAGAGVPASPRATSATINPTNLPGMLGTSSLPPRPATPDRPALPANMPPGIGPQASGFRKPSGMPAMPMTPPMSMETPELNATGQTTNLLGFTCAGYEIRQRGETMEVWATDKLLPFQAWVPNQPHRFGLRRIEEQWPALLKSKKLFPLLAILRFDNGAERLRFEVKALTREKIDDHDGQLFQPPSDYQEIQPLPF